MINKALAEIINEGRQRRASSEQREEDAVEAARNPNQKRHFPGEMDAPGKKYFETQPKYQK